MAIDPKRFLEAINANEKVDAKSDLKKMSISIEVEGKKYSIKWRDEFLTKSGLKTIKASEQAIHKKVFKLIVDTIEFMKSSKKAEKVIKPKQKKVKKEEIIIPEIKKTEKDLVYSYSKRSTFLTSPRDYFFSYVFKLDGKTKGIEKKRKSTALFIGSVFHELLDVYYTAQQHGFSKSEAYKMALVDFDLTWTQEKQEQLEAIVDKKGVTMLTSLNDAKIYFEHYYQYYKKDDFDEVVFAEVSFLSELYKYSDEDLKDYRFLQHIRADLLVKDKGVYKLVEHKTHARDRTVAERVSPQTLEYVEGIQKDLGIKIHSIIFNEIRKAKPKAFKKLKTGNLSTAKASVTNFSKIELDKQYNDGFINEEQYRDGLNCVNMDYYFHREERLVNDQAQKQFSHEMKIATKALARTIAREHENEKNGVEDKFENYPINWTTNKAYPSPFDSIYIAFFEGVDPDTIGEIVQSEFQPKAKYDLKEEDALEKMNRLASMI